jgi:hypothetical protein
VSVVDTAALYVNLFSISLHGPRSPAAVVFARQVCVYPGQQPSPNSRISHSVTRPKALLIYIVSCVHYAVVVHICEVSGCSTRGTATFMGLGPSGFFYLTKNNFEKYSYMKFHENSSSGSQVFPCGRTDGREEANSHFSQFYERA